MDKELEKELLAYTDARMYDPMMSGEAIFKGWNRSQLDRARRLTETRILRELGEENGV